MVKHAHAVRRHLHDVLLREATAHRSKQGQCSQGESVRKDSRLCERVPLVQWMVYVTRARVLARTQIGYRRLSAIVKLITPDNAYGRTLNDRSRVRAPHALENSRRAYLLCGTTSRRLCVALRGAAAVTLFCDNS